jgi:hypothetical protein
MRHTAAGSLLQPVTRSPAVGQNGARASAELAPHATLPLPQQPRGLQAKRVAVLAAQQQEALTAAVDAAALQLAPSYSWMQVPSLIIHPDRLQACMW